MLLYAVLPVVGLYKLRFRGGRAFLIKINCTRSRYSVSRLCDLNQLDSCHFQLMSLESSWVTIFAYR